ARLRLDGMRGEPECEVAGVRTVQRGGRPIRAGERGDVPVRRQPEGVLQREAVPDLQQQIVIPDLRVGRDVGMDLAAQGALRQGLLKERLLGQELVYQRALGSAELPFGDAKGAAA